MTVGAPRNTTSASDQPTHPTPPVAGATGNLIPGATDAGRRRDLLWLKKAEHWGEWRRYSETELAEPESIWMMKGAGGKVRFFAIGKGQVGDEHGSVVQASCWAWANRWCWVDTESGGVDMPAQLECRQWVLNGGADAEYANEPIEAVRG